MTCESSGKLWKKRRAIEHSLATFYSLPACPWMAAQVIDADFWPED